MTTPIPSSATLYGTAEQGIALAASLGMEIPPGWAHATGCVAECRRMLAEGEPQFDGLPEDPAKLRALIVKAAQARAAHAAMREMAETALDYAYRDGLIHYRNALPGFVEQLAAQFDQAAGQFLEARKAAADTISASDSDEQVGEHVAMTRAADALDRLAAIRLQFGATVGEPDLHSTRPWHVIAPASAGETDRVQVCRDVLFGMLRDHRTWQARSPVNRWTVLAQGGDLSMALLRRVAERAETWQRVEAETPGDPMMTAMGSGIAQRERDQRMRAAAGWRP